MGQLHGVTQGRQAADHLKEGLGAARVLPFARNRVARYAMGLDEQLPAPIQQIVNRLPGLGGL